MKATAINFSAQRKEELISLTQELIRIKSLTGQEEAIIQFLKEKMLEMGFEEVFIDEMGNLIGRIGSGKKILAIDAHVDTVAVGRQRLWKFNPLGGDVSQGKIYGRGACDQKGGLAAALLAVKFLITQGFPKNLTLYFVASICEEDYEGLSWQFILNNKLFQPKAVLLTEPTDLTIACGQRGRMDIKVGVQGLPSHGSEPDMGINAINLMATIIQELKTLHESLPTDEIFGKSTLAVTAIQSASNSLNTTPHHCSIHIDRRLGKKETEEKALNEILSLPGVHKANAKVFVPKSEVKTYRNFICQIKHYFPCWLMEEQSLLVSVAKNAFEDAFHKQAKLSYWRFSTNGVATKGGYKIPTIGFGPGKERFAHTKMEHVAIDDLVAACNFYFAFIQRFAKAKKNDYR
ncbi:MAG: YgeY family selenium metabolism-linked hydrolase [Candidatus Heimdallarchaeota archaeon]